MILFSSHLSNQIQRISRSMLQGLETSSDALFWLWCKANYVRSLSPRVIVSGILQIWKKEAVKIYSKSKAIRKAVKSSKFSSFYTANMFFHFALDNKMTASLKSTLVSYFCWSLRNNHNVFCCTYSAFSETCNQLFKEENKLINTKLQPSSCWWPKEKECLKEVVETAMTQLLAWKLAWSCCR